MEASDEIKEGGTEVMPTATPDPPETGGVEVMRTSKGKPSRSAGTVGDEQGRQCGRDHTTLCVEEEPAYRRYETEYAERERERHKEYIYIQECKSYK